MWAQIHPVKQQGHQNNQNPCSIPKEPDMYPLEVLKRFIRNEEINKILNFIDVDPFYQRYLKYKETYLNLKKILCP